MTLLTTAGLLTLATLLTGAPAPAGTSGGGAVRVREEAGLYAISARLDVPQAPSLALAVLVDYEHIPRFMPGITSSIVRERSSDCVLVEQEAEAHLLMFSRRIHLLLEVRSDRTSVRFRDTGGRSFSHYAGAWTLDPLPGGGTSITYVLEARPNFDVPAFVLSRLLKRDAVRMIESLRRELSARAGGARRDRPALTS